MTNIFVVFDQDGVILDSEPIHFKALRSYFQNKEIEYSLETHESFLGYNQKSFFTILKKRFDLKDSIPDLISEAKSYYKNFEHEIELMPDVLDTFQSLAKNHIPLALATSTNRELTNGNLIRFDIKKFFSHTICGDEVQNGKPHPEIYQKAQEKIRKPKALGFAIEDSPAGIQSAKASGLKVIAYKTHHNHRADLSQADHECRSHKDILKYISQYL